MRIILISIVFILFSIVANAQFGVPTGEKLVFGGQFMDRMKPVPILSPLTSDTWGAENVVPRDISNGIEDPDWSHWGGKIIKAEDGKYHMFPCRWPESSPRGHRTWMHSKIVHLVSDNPLGPYKFVAEIGPGHNPTIYRQADGSYVIYSFIRTEGRALTYYYRSTTGINGLWAINVYEYDLRERPGAYIQASNFGIAGREDGAFLAVDKKGTMLISQTGTSKWFALGTGRVYPPHNDKRTVYEDPALWYDGVQYHMITHNYPLWEAYYLRSKDGVHWVTEPGLAYGKAKCVYEDGTVNEWWRYERVMVLQDELGRAMQINFAALDVDKDTDKGSDNHSSKNVCIPLTVGRQLEVLNPKPINGETTEIRLLVKAEQGFNPLEEMDINTLRFGAAGEVNFGRGCIVKNTEKSGKDLILVFDAKGHGFTPDNFAGKLLGKTKQGKLLFGWSRLPGVNYYEPILSAMPPQVIAPDYGVEISIDVSNFGQVASDESAKLEVYIEDKMVASRTVPSLEPFEEMTLKFKIDMKCLPGSVLPMATKLIVNERVQEELSTTVKTTIH